ncbi:MAG: YraN family protein [Candidatus Methylomirabilales bacterium]
MAIVKVAEIGEEAAARFLRRRGYAILARNWRIPLGELDIVARRGRTLVFVEVKARRSSDFLDPAEGVDWAKQARLRRLAAAYLAIEGPEFTDCRFDVVSVLVGAKGPVIRHLPGAFS